MVGLGSINGRVGVIKINQSNVSPPQCIEQCYRLLRHSCVTFLPTLLSLYVSYLSKETEPDNMGLPLIGLYFVLKFDVFKRLYNFIFS